MGTRFRLELHAEGYDDVVCAGEFTDAETATLELYLEQYEAIAESPILSAGLSCNMNVEWTEQSMRVETDMPDEDTIGLLLHRLRPFILDREQASFSSVSSIIGQHVDIPAVRDLLRRQRREYDGRAFQERMRISIDDVVVNSERTLKDWLNSHEYHHDADKRDDIGPLLAVFPEDFTRGVLINMLIDKMRACTNLARLVALLLGRRGALQFGSSEEAMSAGSRSDDLPD
jgi:hypothetical protein